MNLNYLQNLWITFKEECQMVKQVNAFKALTFAEIAYKTVRDHALERAAFDTSG